MHRARRSNNGEFMLRIVLSAVALLVFAVTFARNMDKTGQAPVVKATSSKPSTVAQAPTPVNNNSRSMVIKAGQGGHFEVEARVDGRRLPFIVDTGASQITIRESDAGRLGIRPSRSDYTIRISTANGEGRAAAVDLRSVEVGDIVVRNLQALVVPDSALSVNLLGMSFLSRVRWSHERGKLMLEQ
jgi:aspartyl protease family protein